MEIQNETYNYLVKARKFKRDAEGDVMYDSNDITPLYEIRNVYVNEETYNIMKNDKLNRENSITELEERINVLESK